jgi:hypothetical protein
MPNIIISKIKPRRGTKQQLDVVELDQGEIASTTDTKRLYIGTGSGYGGFVVGNKIHTPVINFTSLSSLISEVGDIVYANNKTYQLTSVDYTNIASWGDISTKIDTNIFKYTSDNKISIDTNSLSASYIKSSTVLSGIKIVSGILQADYNTNSLEISANKLSLKAGGIGVREINSNSFGDGISGGSNNIIKLAVNPSQFYFDSQVLTLSSLPSAWFGSGLSYNYPVISTILTDVDTSTSTIVKNLTGGISLSAIVVPASNQLASIEIDQYGRTIRNQSAIFDVLTGNASLSSSNNTNSLSAIFNGYPGQIIDGAISGLKLTTFTAVSSNGSTITLSSAGFILFDTPSIARSGASIGRFAIPIFSY